MHTNVRCLPLLLIAACANAASEGPVMTASQGAIGAVELEARDYDGAGGEAAPTDRKLIRTAWLVFEIDDDGDERKQLNQKAQQVANGFGGHLATESASGFTMRVPADQLDEAIEALEKLGEVTGRGHRVSDVSRQHRDLGIRIENAKHLQARLRSLLEKAQDVKEILAVEKELSRVTLELETLEAEMRNLSRQIALATIDVRYEDDVSPGPVGWVFYGLFKGVKWLFVWD